MGAKRPPLATMAVSDSRGMSSDSSHSTITFAEALLILNIREPG